MFDGFALETIDLSEASLRVRHGGSGPPVLLLHGHPRTHTTWHKVAPLLASSFTVVCPDLRGFGMSSKPQDTPDHRNSSKREKARDCIELMQRLGHDRFAIVGHDRGAYTAFRTALDHPEVISKLVVMDAVPILEALERSNEKFARLWWHWFFFGEPEKPEQAINANPDAWYRNTPEKALLMGEDSYADYLCAVHDPATIHGMIEDYRAGLGIDRQHDFEDRENGRRVACPTLILWSLKDDLEELYGNVLEVWKPWTTELKGAGINAGHHVAEEAPVELAAALRAFIS
jgi:haloacetate dehalogenase